MTFLDDRPHHDPAHDEFGLAPFARRLARAIKLAQSNQNMVVGINGEWGSGKTTSIEFAIAYLVATEKLSNAEGLSREELEDRALDQLRDEGEDFSSLGTQGSQSPNETVVVRYNPWLVSGHESLIADLFQILGDRAAKCAPDDLSRSQVRRYAANVADFISAVGRIGAKASDYYSAMAPIEPTSGLAARIGGRVAGDVHQTFGRYADKLRGTNEPQTLQEARERLGKALRKIDRKFLLVVDDIDRLEQEEIKAILSTVKSVGALPKVTYLLGYDKRIVERALGEETSDRDGHPTFLEKIVQLELNMPPVAAGKLQKAFQVWLPEILGRQLTKEETSDLKHDLWLGSVFLRTPRDLNRLKNAVRFVRMALDRNVRITDVIRMEMIRLKEPRYFSWLLGNTWILGLGQSLPTTSSDEKDRKAVVKDGLSHCSRARRQGCLELLSRTFPNFEAEDIHGVINVEIEDPYLGFPLSGQKGWASYTALYPHEDTVPIETWEQLNEKADNQEFCNKLCASLLASPRSDGMTMFRSLLDDLSRLFEPENGSSLALLKAIVGAPDEAWWPSNDVRSFSTDYSAIFHLVSLVPESDRFHELLGLFEHNEAPLGVAVRFLWVVSYPYDYPCERSSDQEVDKLMSEEDVRQFGKMIADRLANSGPDEFGRAVSVVPAIELIKAEHGAEVLKSKLRELLLKHEAGALELVRYLARAVELPGRAAEMFDQTDIYPFEEIYEFAKEALNSGRFTEGHEYLRVYVHYYEKYHSSE